MKKNVNKVSSEFEKLLTEEFQNKNDAKAKSQENCADNHEQVTETLNNNNNDEETEKPKQNITSKAGGPSPEKQ